MRPSVYCVSWNSAIGCAELLAIDDVLGGLLERRLREAARAAAGLEPAGGEARHLQVEAAADARARRRRGSRPARSSSRS